MSSDKCVQSKELKLDYFNEVSEQIRKHQT